MKKEKIYNAVEAAEEIVKETLSKHRSSTIQGLERVINDLVYDKTLIERAAIMAVLQEGLFEVSEDMVLKFEMGNTIDTISAVPKVATALYFGKRVCVDLFEDDDDGIWSWKMEIYPTFGHHLSHPVEL